jgi:hypothetical protein
MKTEKEAKELWCPFARYGFMSALHDRNITGINRAEIESSAGQLTSHENPDYARCIASQCMAWRWDPKQVVGEYMVEHRGRPENRKGYCGLAGKP